MGIIVRSEAASAGDEQRFEAVADELYGLAPADFTTARNQAADQARKAGGRALADRIRQLRRPTLSAWALNLLVRTHPEETGQLLELGQALRAAQDELSGARLRELSVRRQQLVTALTALVRDTAAEAGHRLGDQAVGEAERTLRAALADGVAAQALVTGRLVTALDVPAGLPDTAPDRSPPAEPARAEAVAKAAEPPAPLAEAREAVRDAEQERRQAEEAAARIHRELDSAVRARERADQEAERTTAAQARAQERQRETHAAEREKRTAARQADGRAERARRRADREQGRLRKLTPSG